jgi:hypothetical protein
MAVSAGTGAPAPAEGGPSSGESGGRVDYFISHADPDSSWAEWVAATLLGAGFSVELGVWDWTAGTSFVAAMNRALGRAGRMIALASPEYFARTWSSAQLHPAFVQRAHDEGFLVPVLVRPCGPGEYPPLLEPLIRIELAGLDEAAARDELLERLAGPRRPPAGTTIPFPGRAPGTPMTRSPSGLPAVFPGRLPPVWGPVPARNLFFTGRDRLLADLNDRPPIGWPPIVRASRTALQGIGGVGKTQLAVEYAWRHAGDVDLVWWVDAETPTGLAAGLAGLATALGVGAGDVPERAAAALAELGRRQNWLLVYDNATDPTALAVMLPPTSGRLLVTCRDQALRRIVGDVLAVTEFTRGESIELLRRHVPELPDPAADRLADALGDLPLAIDQAGAFLAATGMDTATYQPLLAEQPQLLLADDTPHHQGLAATVSAAYDRLRAEDPFAAVLLDQLAFLAPEPVQLAAVPSGDIEPIPGALLVADPLTTHTALEAISRYALARRTGTTVQVHRLVHALLRARLSAAEARQALGGAIALLGAVARGNAENPAAWPVYAALTPHVIAVSSRFPESGEITEPDPFRRLLDATCWYLFNAGQYSAAQVLADATHARWTRTLGPDHAHCLTIATTLAASLGEQGDHVGARSLDDDTLARRRRLLGDDHRHTLRSASNLAVRLAALGNHQAAKALDEDTLARRRRTLGDDHRDTLISANNLAIRLAALGDHQAARSLDEDTLARRRRLLGPDHPETLTSANNLANRLAALGYLEEAVELNGDTLARRQRVLGHDHPDTLRSASNLESRLQPEPDSRQPADRVTAPPFPAPSPFGQPGISGYGIPSGPPVLGHPGHGQANSAHFAARLWRKARSRIASRRGSRGSA